MILSTGKCILILLINATIQHGFEQKDLTINHCILDALYLCCIALKFGIHTFLQTGVCFQWDLLDQL